MKIAYFVHDLNDSAVARRVRMLKAAGGEPLVIGFRRRDGVPAEIAGAPVIDLGLTHDSRLLQRALAVLGNVLRPGTLLDAAQGSEVIIGRNLEMLVLAARARRVVPRAKLVYECLDIHRMLLGNSLPARMIQAIEARLLRAVDLLLTSSPAFVTDYFARRPTFRAPTLLLENKLLAIDGAPPPLLPAPAGPPWTIAWFGMLRCARTFDILADLVHRHEGRVNVHIAGRASPAIFPDFERRVASVPGFTYHGAYTAADLPSLYAPCNFAWAIDYFEEGQNSQWLLPNRLYEAAAFGVVPIALASVETGKWLEAHRAGVTLGDDRAELDPLIESLDEAGYADLRRAIAGIPRGDLIADRTDCDSLVAALKP